MSSRQLCVFRALGSDLDWSEMVVTTMNEDKITRENMWSEKKAWARTQEGLY